MYNNDTIYTDMDLFSQNNRLFALNDASNIWSSDKMISLDFKSKFMINNQAQFGLQDRFARNRKPPGDRKDTNLIVNYLPDGFYEKDLFDLFSQAGAIVHHHVVRNKDNRSECYGFVDFEKASDAEKAIEMFHQFSIQNKKLKVQNAAEGLQIKEEERHRAMKCITNIGYNVEVRNAPLRWTTNEVKNIFGKYGELVKVYETSNDDVENLSELKAKTFNIIYRYHTIASKVVKKRNKTAAEALWPLELEVAIIGQEIIDVPSETARPRQRTHKTKFDQLSESSLDPKVDSNIFYPKTFENTINYWAENSELIKSNIPLSVNGRPILKHKDNLMHLSNSIFDTSNNSDLSDKWNYPLNDTTNSFFENMHSDLKAIWAPKEVLNQELIPHDIFVKTPLLPSRYKSAESNKYKANVWLKMENMQPSGSFKLRGMAYWCYKAKLDGVQTVISSSGGNAGLAAAYASRMFNMKCVVVIPRTTSSHIINELCRENAEVIVEGNSWKEAHMKAESLSLTTPRSQLVHPFDNTLLWSGYESMVDEIVTDMKGVRIDMIVLSVGGGGLLNGIAQGISKNKLTKTTAILALETDGCASFNRSISANQMISMTPNSVATSLGASTISQRTWDIYNGMEFHLFSKTCTDFEAVESCYQFLNEQNCLVEPACGASLSTIYNGTLDRMAECRSHDLNVVVIVCGGRCMDINGLLETRHSLSLIADNSTQSYDVYSNQNASMLGSGSSLLNGPPLDQFSGMDLNKDCYLSLLSNDATISGGNLASDLFCGGGSRQSLFNNSPTPYNQPRLRNYASVLGDMTPANMTPGNRGCLLDSSINNNISNSYFQYSSSSLGNNYADVPSPVGSQHSDKENRMLHH